MKVRNGASVELYRELVPLGEAAAAAYHIITEKPERLRERSQLDEVRGVVAIALSTVGTLLKEENGVPVPVGQKEIRERLFVRHGAQPQLEGLFMRRVDLLRAVEVLREAHFAFDRRHILESIQKLS